MSQPALKKWSDSLDQRIRRILKLQRNSRIPLQSFRLEFPSIAHNLMMDAKSNIWDLWGESLNFDEFEKCRIVDRKLLRCLSRIVGRPIGKGNVYHAGLLHTYGYLLSTIDTRYGKKRERWVSGSVAKLLGVPIEHFTPLANNNHSMLQNLTASLTAIASEYGFRNSNQIPMSRFSVSGLEYRASKIVETVRVSGGRLKLHTLLLSPLRENEKQSLCIYWLGDRTNCRLVTCFPMAQQGVQELLQQPSGAKVPIRPRYNAYVHCWPAGQTIDGVREIEN